MTSNVRLPQSASAAAGAPALAARFSRRGVLTGLLLLPGIGGLMGARSEAPPQHHTHPPAGPVTPAAGFAGAAGIVVDSVHGGVLAGAVVVVEGTPRRAITDSAGQFRIDSISPGTHRLMLEAPFADTLGFALSTKPIEMVEGRYEVVALGIPSARTIRRIVCEGTDTTSGPGFVIGLVRDPDTNEPLVGSHVSLTYTETQIAQKRFTRIGRRRDATVGPEGTYAICGLPEGLGGTVQADLDSLSHTVEVPVLLAESFLAVQSLTVAPANRTARAVVQGKVVTRDGTPLAGANVTVIGATKGALTGPDGTFSLEWIPSGTTAVMVRKVGFTPASRIVNLTAHEPREVKLELFPSTQMLTPVNVMAAIDANLQRAGFNDRRNSGLGHFIGPEEIEKKQPYYLSDLLRTVPGFRVTNTDSGTVIETRRSQAGQLSSCVNVFVDNMRWPSMGAGELDRAFSILDIAAMETYAGTLSPAIFNVPGENCATIVIWTRTKMAAVQRR